ncbi:MAG: pyridoxal phosphate-dependent aminotransferase [Paracoccaceae bacterium]
MRYAKITDRLSTLGGSKWALHSRARALRAAGEDILEFTIGEPDVPTPQPMREAATAAIAAGRTGYSNGRGEPALLKALSDRYGSRLGRPVGTDQFICLPGTQTAIFAALKVVADEGDEVIVGDPMYATYEAVVVASGARVVPVPLRPEKGFRLQAADVAAAISPRTRAIFLNSPHNPTGAILTRDEIIALGDLAKKHDLWLISDEVYEDLIFPGETFLSPFALDDLAPRTVVCTSISKSHAAPGFRTGWCLGSPEFAARLLPLAETMLFGNQPFIADMTAAALAAPSPVAAGMVERFARRARLFHAALDGKAGLRVHRPQAGMFVVIDVRATGLSGIEFATALLDQQKVAVMPGESFGQSFGGWLRVSLGQSDDICEEGCRRILSCAETLRKAA